MSRSDNDRLGDIIRSGRRAAGIVGCGREVFDGSWALQDLAAHHIGITVDAFRNLSAPAQQKFGEMSIEAMAGMRVRLLHMYWETDIAVVWQTISEDLPHILEIASREYRPPATGPTVFDEDATLALPAPPGHDMDSVSLEPLAPSQPPKCGKTVKSAGRPCLLHRGHRGRCRSVIG